MRRSALGLSAGAAFAATLFANARATAPGVTEMVLERTLVAELLVLFGCAFLLAAAIGLARFPDVYTRLHAATKLVTLGGVGIFGGAAVAFASVDATGRVLLIAAFFFLTAPLSGYMIARSGYLRGLEPYREDSSVDEWRALGAARADDASGSPDSGGLETGRFETGRSGGGG